MTLKVRILPFLTTFVQLSARLKNFLVGWLLVLGLEEGLVECATLCAKSWVILGNSRIENGSAIGNGNADYLEYFNSDIICHHGQLCIQEVKRKLVCGKVWKKFKSYFPTARAFPKSSMPCNFCMDNDDKVKKAIEDKKELANSQKNALSDIFNERCRPSWARTSTERVYLVPRA